MVNIQIRGNLIEVVLEKLSANKISKLQMDSISIDKDYKKVLSTLSVAKNQKQQIEDDIQNLVDIEQKILPF